jgi:hypothetical protein
LATVFLRLSTKYYIHHILEGVFMIKKVDGGQGPQPSKRAKQSPVASLTKNITAAAVPAFAMLQKFSEVSTRRPKATRNAGESKNKVASTVSKNFKVDGGQGAQPSKRAKASPIASLAKSVTAAAVPAFVRLQKFSEVSARRPKATRNAGGSKGKVASTASKNFIASSSKASNKR